MSITTAFNNALSGLRASGRATEVISTNISNATTPGYARREIELSSVTANLVGGVTVVGVNRMNDPVIVAARRDAQADFGYASTITDFVTRLENTVGTPDNPGALTNMLAEFEAKLLSASSRPDAAERHDSAVAAAASLVDLVNRSSDAVTQMRSDAEEAIGAQITRLNNALEEVERLNSEIGKVNVSGQDASSLLDLRQQVIDEIHEMVPVQVAQRENGKVALYSKGGVILLDSTAREVEFTATNRVTPYMTIEAGLLSGLTVNGNAVSTTVSNGGIPGGTIAAQFAIRDSLGTDALSQLDAFARNLVERFQNPAVDPSLAPGDAGLFTDEGAAFDPLDEVGLAERLQLNAAVDPAQGGESRRLRDGINTAAPGPVGQSAILDNLRDALNLRQTPASGDFGTGLMSISDIASSMMSRIGVQRLGAEQSLTFASTTFFEMSQAERAAGVDTDAELQRLIVVEQMYAANARVITTIDAMMDELMRIAS